MIRFLLVLSITGGLAAQPGGLLEQADEAFRQGDLERAGALASRAIEADPAAVHGHMILGVIAAQKSQWRVSDSHFETVVKLDPASPHGYFYLGQSKLYQKQWDAAIRFFTSALERQYPETGRLLVELALAQNEAGRPREALGTLAKTQPPPDPRLAAQYYGVTGFAQGNLNQLDQALEAIQHALQLDDAAPDYWTFLIDLLIRTEQNPRALAEAIRAQRKFPDQQEIQFLFALASYHVTESPLSRLALRNLQEADPADPRVLLAEGLAQRKEGNAAEATAAFRKAAARGVPDAHLLLGILLREAGDDAEAEREYREAERINPNNGQALMEMAKALTNKGDLEGALTRLKRAVELMPSTPAVHYQLGGLYRRMGRNDEAEQHLNLFRKLQADRARQTRPAAKL
ncbi:MAG TPA: tetratricopeptide repeat protein [Bryobacteraceae bacterium]|nr:tetratricopeptide repeat protein [Bryobacteraceae bacterium]